MSGGLLREQDIPDDLRDIVLPQNGHSAIFGPNGDILAGPLIDEEGILTAKANLGTLMTSRMISDHAGHYTRPDVFDFRVNRRPKQIARFDDVPGGWDQEQVRRREANGFLPSDMPSEEDLRALLSEVVE